MEEVALQIKPFAEHLGDLSVRLRSLYRNGDKGAPGFLEVAREQDQEKLDELVKAQQETLKQLREVQDSRRHELGKQEGRAEAVKDSDRTMKIWLGVLTIVIAFLGLVIMFIEMNRVKTGELVLPKVFQKSHNWEYSSVKRQPQIADSYPRY